MCVLSPGLCSLTRQRKLDSGIFRAIPSPFASKREGPSIAELRSVLVVQRVKPNNLILCIAASEPSKENRAAPSYSRGRGPTTSRRGVSPCLLEPPDMATNQCFGRRLLTETGGSGDGNHTDSFIPSSHQPLPPTLNDTHQIFTTLHGCVSRVSTILGL